MSNYYLTKLAVESKKLKMTPEEMYAQLYEGRLRDDDMFEADAKFKETRTIKLDRNSIPETKMGPFKWLYESARVNELINNNLHTEYETFRIPKNSGGYRTITAPSDELKEIQRAIKGVFEKPYGMLTHNNAYAYVKGRTALDALKVHTENKSKWYLKLDIKDFFPSSTTDWVLNQLDKLVGLHGLKERPGFQKIIQLCTYQGALPQGAVTSPLLTNLIFIPLDYELTKASYNKFGLEQGVFKYTRYADDIIISSTLQFNKEEVIKVVEDILKDTPYRLKHEKTRYGSTAGRNWNLGLMINKDNKITLGHRRKQRLKSALYNFFRDAATYAIWNQEDAQHFQGELAYFKQVEPEYAQHLIRKQERRWNISLTVVLKRQLGTGV